MIIPNPSSAILFSVGSFYPDPSGGPNITMYWLSKALFRNGVDVYVLTTDRGIDQNLPRNRWLKMDFGKGQYVHTWSNHAPLLLLIKSIWAIRKMDTVYLASFFYPLSFLMAPIALLLGKQVIWGPRGETSKDALQFGSFRKRVVLSFIRRIKSRIIFHATSTAETSDIQRVLGTCRIEYISNGMELSEPVTCNREPLNLLFLGRIHPIKGLGKLLEAIALSSTFINSKHQLIIAGYAQQGYDLILQDQIHHLRLTAKVVFIGKVDGKEKDQLIAGSYALILPSFSENFGAVVAEALAQGTPVIASLGTPWEILETNKAGYHVNHEPELLAAAIDRLFSLPTSEYYAMKLNARNLAVEKLNINSNIHLWINLLQNK